MSRVLLERIPLLASLATLLLVLAWPPDRAAAASSALPSAAAIASRLNLAYRQTRSFQASFKQTYSLRMHGKKTVARGHVAFKKPGLVSFRYDTPAGNRVVSDGRRVRIYDHAQARLYDMDAEVSLHPAALAFLGGAGRLHKDFRLRALAAPEQRAKTGYVLEAVPRVDSPAYRKFVLYIDRRSHQVRRVLIVDAHGNWNRFDFFGVLENKPIASREFRLSAPRGTQVIKP
jgi:outer membrane lipoprotein carrier protein